MIGLIQETAPNIALLLLVPNNMLYVFARPNVVPSLGRGFSGSNPFHGYAVGF